MIKCKECNKEFKKDIDNEFKLLTPVELMILSHELFKMQNLDNYESAYKCPNCAELNKEGQ